METTSMCICIYISDLYRKNGKENGNCYNVYMYWGYIGRMEKKMRQ